VYNLLFVLEDKSYGIHNTAYTVGLLKASLADLGGTTPTPGGTAAEANAALAAYFSKSTNVLINPYVLGKGLFQMGINDIVGWQFRVQASSDLITWTNLPTTAYPAYQFNDPDATNAPKRFYRLMYP
jgi:hypothetical protein